MSIIERDVSFCGPIYVDFFDFDKQKYFSNEPFTYTDNVFEIPQTTDPSFVGEYNIGVWVYFAAFPNDAYGESTQSFKLTIDYDCEIAKTLTESPLLAQEYTITDQAKTY